ncbi:hypothetical protein ACFLXE_06685 [Chloroflexota bacterium]
MATIELCSLCSMRLTSTCEDCTDAAHFEPDILCQLEPPNHFPGYYPDHPRRIITMRDIEGYSPMEIRAFILWLAQRRQRVDEA